MMEATVLEFTPVRRALPNKRRSPNLWALKAEARPGCCIVCDRRLPKSRGKKPRTDLCGEPECKRVHSLTCWLDLQHRQKSRSARHLRNLASP